MTIIGVYIIIIFIMYGHINNCGENNIIVKRYILSESKKRLQQ